MFDGRNRLTRRHLSRPWRTLCARRLGRGGLYSAGELLGATGSGKSTLLANLVLQDAEAHRGAVVLDSKGDLVDDILDRRRERQPGG